MDSKPAGFSSCGAWAQLLHLPGPRIEPISPAFTGGFLYQGNPYSIILKEALELMTTCHLTRNEGLVESEARIYLKVRYPDLLSTKKRCTTWELWVKFYWGQNEDCSPGGSISDSSERLLQSGSGGKSIYNVLVKGEFNIMKHSIYKRFFVSHEGLMSPWRDLVLL